LIQAAEQEWYAYAHPTCLIRGCPNEQNIARQTREQKKCFTFLMECLMAFKFFQSHDQIRSNTIKQHQTSCPNFKMFGHQTMFDGVWSPDVGLLIRAWTNDKCLATKHHQTMFGEQTFHRLDTLFGAV